MWTNKIASFIFTELKKRGLEKLSAKTEYADAFFTTSSRVQTSAKFPTIYLEKLQGSEQARTLEKGVPNAIVSTFQVIVTDNVSQFRANDVADIVSDIMNELGYELMADPTPTASQDTYQNIARYRRTIGKNEKIIP